MSDDYTKVSIGDLDDVAGARGAQGMEARVITAGVGSGRVGAMHHRMDAGVRQPFGHAHNESEEIYIVLEGAGTIKVGDDDVPITAGDAVRVAPQAIRAFEAGPDGLTYLAIGNHVESDGRMLMGWWGGPGEG